MLNRSRIMKQIAEIHKDDRTLDLVNTLDLSRTVWTAALYMRSLLIEAGCTRRSPHCLFVDCIFLISKKINRFDITQRCLYHTTKEVWGMGTNPFPSKWYNEYKDIVKKVLDTLV